MINNEANKSYEIHKLAGVNIPKIVGHKISLFTKKSINRLKSGFKKVIFEIEKSAKTVSTGLKTKVYEAKNILVDASLKEIIGDLSSEMNDTKNMIDNIEEAINFLEHNNITACNEKYPCIKTEDDKIFYMESLKAKRSEFIEKKDTLFSLESKYTSKKNEVSEKYDASKSDFEQVRSAHDASELPQKENHTTSKTDTEEVIAKKEVAKINGRTKIFIAAKYFTKMVKNGVKLPLSFTKRNVQAKVDKFRDNWREKHPKYTDEEVASLASDMGSLISSLDEKEQKIREIEEDAQKRIAEAQENYSQDTSKRANEFFSILEKYGIENKEQLERALSAMGKVNSNLEEKIGEISDTIENNLRNNKEEVQESIKPEIQENKIDEQITIVNKEDKIDNTKAINNIKVHGKVNGMVLCSETVVKEKKQEEEKHEKIVEQKEKRTIKKPSPTEKKRRLVAFKNTLQKIDKKNSSKEENNKTK